MHTDVIFENKRLKYPFMIPLQFSPKNQDSAMKPSSSYAIFIV